VDRLILTQFNALALLFLAVVPSSVYSQSFVIWNSDVPGGRIAVAGHRLWEVSAMPSNSALRVDAFDIPSGEATDVKARKILSSQFLDYSGDVEFVSSIIAHTSDEPNAEKLDCIACLAHAVPGRLTEFPTVWNKHWIEVFYWSDAEATWKQHLLATDTPIRDLAVSVDKDHNIFLNGVTDTETSTLYQWSFDSSNNHWQEAKVHHFPNSTGLHFASLSSRQIGIWNVYTSNSRTRVDFYNTLRTLPLNTPELSLELELEPERVLVSQNSTGTYILTFTPSGSNYSWTIFEADLIGNAIRKLYSGMNEDVPISLHVDRNANTCLIVSRGQQLQTKVSAIKINGQPEKATVVLVLDDFVHNPDFFGQTSSTDIIFTGTFVKPDRD
jgi:hypothetical protein